MDDQNPKVKVCCAVWKSSILLERQSFERIKKQENLPVVVIAVKQKEMSAGLI